MNLESIAASVPQTGEYRTVCPECSPLRKKSSRKELSVKRSNDLLLYSCFHCGAEGAYKTEKGFSMSASAVVSAVPSSKVVLNELMEQHLKFLSGRGISKETAVTAKLFAADRWFAKTNRTAECIGFPYYKGGQLVSAKYRNIGEKEFTQETGGAHSFFNLDSIVPDKPIVIVEGEIDCLTLMEIGVPNALSVPMGAPLKVVEGKVSPSDDKRFSFVWDAFETLTKAPWVIIATDNDSPGHALAEELSRRIGKDRCKLVKLADCKDFNELFLRDGGAAVTDAIDKAEPYPVQGISSAKDFSARLNDLWNKGTGTGESTGYKSVDQIYTVVPGQLTVVTGYPSSGKSNFVDQIMVNLARDKDWKFALCSFENAPEIHIARLIELYSNKRFFEGKDRMSEDEFKQAYAWVQDHFVFLTSESSNPANADSIIERARISVARMGIRGLVIDPYNYIEMERGASETEAISNMLTRVQQFAKNSGVHVWFVAHPAKMLRSGADLPRPDGMAISGSMAWWAKADCGLTVHRLKNDTQIAVWKCRYRWVGQVGETLLTYEKTTGSYKECNDYF